MSTSKKRAAGVPVLAALLLAGAWSVAAAVAPADKCESSKNKLTGKYAACRQSAEARAITSGDPPNYSKCNEKFLASWQKAEARAGNSGASCPDEPLDPVAMQSFVESNSGAIASALNGGPLPADAASCNAELTTCTSDLSSCNGSLETCDGNYASCSTSLATCNAGTTGAADVLSPKTFSSSAGLGLAGTMTNVGQQNVTPGTTAVTITQGYHNGTGAVAGDADLVAGSIKTGVNLFGVDGNVIQASGDAVAADVLSSKTFSNAGGADTGTMTNVGQQNVTPGIAAVTITQGYHNGTGTVAGDADLVAGNIKGGVNLFGVAGTLNVPTNLSLLKTGQTDCDTTGGGVMGACPGTPAGQDGSLQRGTTRSYTNNGDGTITDNVTGLMWENLCDQDPPGATCPTAHDADSTYSWVDAFAKVASMNTANYASHNDWRLPNVTELQSLADYSATGTAAAVDAVFRTGCTAPCSGTSCSCAQAGYYWSSTTYGPGPVSAWAVYFYDGRSYASGKGVVYYVRAVRGG